MSLDTRSLPLFPLPDVVLFPGSPLPLHIFEPRYREMIATILDGDKLFGVLLIDSRHQVATIGSAAEVIEVEKLPDGRMNILTVGIRRFKVIDTNFDKDYLQGDIQWLDDNASDSEDEENARKMAQEVRDAIKDILDLTSKLNDYHIPMPEDLPLDAESLSFWVASTMYNLAEEQQVLLEMRDTGTRLRNEAEALKMTIKGRPLWHPIGRTLRLACLATPNIPPSDGSTRYTSPPPVCSDLMAIDDVVGQVHVVAIGHDCSDHVVVWIDLKIGHARAIESKLLESVCMFGADDVLDLLAYLYESGLTGRKAD
ncbi:hypothetical protein Lal_00044905 [Lupinus albus]|nr:hypothetical protein Lal_00044905 [Lupinus albus]